MSTRIMGTLKRTAPPPPRITSTLLNKHTSRRHHSFRAPHIAQVLTVSIIPPPLRQRQRQVGGIRCLVQEGFGVARIRPFPFSQLLEHPKEKKNLLLLPYPFPLFVIHFFSPSHLFCPFFFFTLRNRIYPIMITVFFCSLSLSSPPFRLALTCALSVYFNCNLLSFRCVDYLSVVIFLFSTLFFVVPFRVCTQPAAVFFFTSPPPVSGFLPPVSIFSFKS